MVKHTQTVRRQHLTNCLSVFDHFVALALKELKVAPSFLEIVKDFPVLSMFFSNLVISFFSENGDRF